MVDSSQSWRLKLLISLKEDEKLRTHWVINQSGFQMQVFCARGQWNSDAEHCHCLCPLTREAFSRKTVALTQRRMSLVAWPQWCPSVCCVAPIVLTAFSVWVHLGRRRVTPLWATDVWGRLVGLLKVFSSLLNWKSIFWTNPRLKVYIYSLLKKTILRKIFTFKKFAWGDLRQRL